MSGAEWDLALDNFLAHCGAEKGLASASRARFSGERAAIRSRMVVIGYMFLSRSFEYHGHEWTDSC